MSYGEVTLWGIGVLIAVVLALLGGNKLVRSRSQKQAVNSGSIGIQAGRDAKINDGQQTRARSKR